MGKCNILTKSVQSRQDMRLESVLTDFFFAPNFSHFSFSPDVSSCPPPLISFLLSSRRQSIPARPSALSAACYILNVGADISNPVREKISFRRFFSLSRKMTSRVSVEPKAPHEPHEPHEPQEPKEPKEPKENRKSVEISEGNSRKLDSLTIFFTYRRQRSLSLP